MQGDDVQLIGRFRQVRSHALRDESIRQPVETILAETVLLCFRRIDHVSARRGRDGGVESAVEESDVRGVGDGSVDCLDDFEGAGVVQGRQSREGFEVVVGVSVDAGGFGVGAAVDDAVAGESYVVGVLELREVLV